MTLLSVYRHCTSRSTACNGFHTPAATPMHNLNEWVDGGHVPVAATLAKPQGVVCWSWGCGGPSLSLPRRKDLLSHTDAVGPAPSCRSDTVRGTEGTFAVWTAVLWGRGGGEGDKVTPERVRRPGGGGAWVRFASLQSAPSAPATNGLHGSQSSVPDPVHCPKSQWLGSGQCPCPPPLPLQQVSSRMLGPERGGGGWLYEKQKRDLPPLAGHGRRSGG